MTTIADVIERVYRDYLLPPDEQPSRFTVNTGGIDDSSTTLPVDLAMLSPEEQDLVGVGTLIEVVSTTTGGELMLVEGVTGTAGTSDATEAGSSSSDDVLVAAAHGLADGDKIQFTAITGGAGLVINKTYFVVNKTTGTFQLSETSGGTAIDFTTDISAGTFEPVSDLTSTHVLDLMQDVWDNGGISEQETAVIIANSWNKRRLSSQFLGTDAGFRQDSRTVGGVNLQTFDTDFGVVNVMLNRYIPTNTVAVASLDELRLKWLDLGGDGLVIEELGKVGSKVENQFYGEWGLMYGNQRSHGKVSGLSTR